MALTFGKVIFGILMLGIIFTGFVKFGAEIQTNSNLDSGTQQYLTNINSSIQDIEDMELNRTDVSLGEEDSFSKQYKEAKLYAQTASGLLNNAGDTPGILINSLDLEQSNNQWLFNYIYLGMGLMIFLVVLYMLFGRKF